MNHEINRPLPNLLRETAQSMGDHPAVCYQGRVVSFAEFDQLTDRVAATLTQSGINKGDRIGLYSINSDVFAVAYFGILKAGGIVVPINLLLNPKEVAWILEDAKARALIWFEDLKESVHAFHNELKSLDFSICIGPQAQFDNELVWDECVAREAVPSNTDIDPSVDIAVILYTSGTTGKPKGAMLTHRNLASNANAVRLALQLEPGRETFLVVLPLFHAFAATVGMLCPLLHGGTLVPLPKFDPIEVAANIEMTQATIFFAVPSMYSVLLRLPNEAVQQMQSLRLCVSGGASMPIEVMRRFETRFGKWIYEGDGPTECSPVTCVNPVSGKRKPGTVGRAVPGVEMKIMDDSGHELPRGEIGEIWVRGPNVMKGYWNRPDATAESLREGWFLTGDLGHEDDEGYFTIVDRKKDLIIVNGMNVYPREIEEVLYTHPAVCEAAVVGEPHSRHGEIPVAYLSLNKGAIADSSVLRNFLLDHLGRHKVPRKFFFLDGLPKNATGKILKRALGKGGELERGVDSREPTE